MFESKDKADHSARAKADAKPAPKPYDGKNRRESVLADRRVATVDYVHQEYPSWRFHATEGKQLVESEKADKALGSGWQDTPVVAKKEK